MSAMSGVTCARIESAVIVLAWQWHLPLILNRTISLAYPPREGKAFFSKLEFYRDLLINEVLLMMSDLMSESLSFFRGATRTSSLPVRGFRRHVRSAAFESLGRSDACQRIPEKPS